MNSNGLVDHLSGHKHDHSHPITTPHHEAIMDDQMPLFPDESIAAEFAVFDAQHPDIYEAYSSAVEQLWHASCRRFGSQGVFWVVRWKYAVNPLKDGGFKIPNKYSPHYARKWQEDNPSRSDFFETRTLKK